MTDGMMETLSAGLPALGLALPEETLQKLCAFARAMVKQNEVMNLTGITEETAVAKLHLLDSLTVAACVELQGKTLIDVGCGAGFPGVPLAIACPDTKVTLLDSLGKRMQWLSSVLPELGISAQCITARAEENVETCRETYDVATSRAVARLNILLELTAPYVKVGGFVVALKGSAAGEELEEAKNAIKKLGLQLEACKAFSFDDAVHSVIVLKKVSSTPGAYPRRFAKIKQNPL
ncbi:MAG: 16S rRNA (guanine(527)-N(7))-methyltransferase RsmG [Ruminococcaceae bacterium]|nr:16S rRNA (guanine(527)-N(7))-methyltransferase RsmG [Oscillospiraceae bacterium]